MTIYNLFDIAKPKQWKTISSEDFDPNGKYSVYGANGIIGKTNIYNHEEETVLITCRGATCGSINLSEPFSYVNGNAMALDELDGSKVVTKYLYYFLQSYNFNSVITGSAQPQITRESLRKVEIPLPDLETQNKIVAILDKAKALLEKREKTIAMYDELLRATFLEMFGDPCNPRRDDLKPLQEIIIDIDAGWSPVCEEIPRNSPKQYAILKQSAITKRYFDPEQNKLLPDGLAIKKGVYAKKSDLLFSRKNTPELVGSTAYVFDDYENLLLPDTIFSLRYDDSKISGIYLCFLFNDKEFRKKIQGLSVGQAKSMSNISQERLLQLKIPRPDLDKQNEFENIVLTTYHSFYKKCLESQLKSELLLKSLSQQAFGDRVNIDVDVELEALIDVIDPDKKDEENSVVTIKKDLTLLQRLIDKLRERDFRNAKQYDKAVYVAFRIMKEEPNLIKQELDATEREVTLKL